MIKLPSLIQVLILVLLLMWSPMGSQLGIHRNVHARPISPTQQPETLFTLLPPDSTNIHFVNQLTLSPTVNYYDYINVFNGGGVAIGDLDLDGKNDIYFTGNQVSNRLYRNLGDTTFEDATDRAKVDGGGGWSTGATLVDIDADGDLDLYVCRAFNDANPQLRRNLLYVNQGDLTFEEKGKSYGIDDPGNSTQATFLDYDRDGDLDLFVGNHPREHIDKEELIRFRKRQDPPLLESDRLYRNNGNGTFSDVTEEAGILNYGFTLGIIASDLNQDGWTDLYIAVDHAEPDIFYVNNQDGTFTDQIHSAFGHISNFGMGVDAADINNDALLDLIVVDMLAKDNFRQKSQMSSMAPRRFWSLVKAGYHYQYMRNSLQLNRGNQLFSEIGQMAGISMTDWSWAALLADFDNDGWKDLFVTNGYRKDTRDNDALIALRERQAAAGDQKQTREELLLDRYEFLMSLSETRLPNYFFVNNKNYTFSDRSALAGLGTKSFSQGCAYGDLDNDGDLDLVVNNQDDPAFVYRNNTAETTRKKSLRVRLLGPSPNLSALGSKVTVEASGKTQYQELTFTRGFQSSVDPILHFGLGDSPAVTSVRVQWPDGKITFIQDPSPSGILTIAYTKEARAPLRQEESAPLFTALPNATDFVHIENDFDDFADQPLLPHQMSRFGPGLATGDVNGDEREDLFVGGAAGQSGVLYLLNEDNQSFSPAPHQAWRMHANLEDLDAEFFDADGDGDLDLYVVSGGNEFPANSPYYQDRLYLNDGASGFTHDADSLPPMPTSGSCVTTGDFDQDGDPDLFVGGRVVPGRYPSPPRSYLLQNTNGVFADVTDVQAKELVSPGLVTSAVFADNDGDGDLDLLVVGEWMSIRFLENDQAVFHDRSMEWGLERTSGWWNAIIACDVDNDGDHDFLVGNLGKNYKYQASTKQPFHVYFDDFDENGTPDIVLGSLTNNQCFPVRGRQCSSEQIPSLKERFPSYREFASATLEEIYGTRLQQALHYEATLFESCLLRNDREKKKFEIVPLPPQAQFSPLNGIVTDDFDQNGTLDILAVGNFFVSEVETGRADAGIGILLSGDGKGNFEAVPDQTHGFMAPLDARNLNLIRTDQGPLIIVANNDGPLQVFRGTKHKKKAR